MNVYRIAMEISIANRVSEVLGTIAADMSGMLLLQRRLTRGFEQMQLALIGATAVLGSGLIASQLKGLIDQGNEWVRTTRNMTQAGVSFGAGQEAQAKAMAASQQYRNVSSTEALRLANDLRGTLGSQDLANEHLIDLVQMGSFLKTYQGSEAGGKNAESLHRELNAAIKSAEIAGKISPQEMREHIRMLTAMKVAFGDQLKVQQYLTAQRTAGVALRNTSDAFRYGMFPALVQENGVNAGTMLMTAFNKIVAGVGNRTLSIQRMAELGLLNEDQVKYDKVGRAIGLKDASAITNNTQAAMNFGDWVMKTLKPLLDKQTAGITNPAMKSIRESQLISGMFPDRNAAKAITEILQQYNKLMKDSRLVLDAAENLRPYTGMQWLKGKRPVSEYLSGSWDYQTEAFGSQWQSFITHLGAPAVGQATKVLGSINEAMAGMASWAQQNPEQAKLMIDTVAGLTAGLAALGVVLAGSVLIGAIGPTGWLVVGLSALAGALMALKPALFGMLSDLGSWLAKQPERFKKELTPDLPAWWDRQKGYWGRAFGSGSEYTPDPGTHQRRQNLFHQSSWEPPSASGGRIIQVNSTIHMDGHAVARGVTTHMADNMEMTRSAAFFDGWRGYADPGQQILTT